MTDKWPLMSFGRKMNKKLISFVCTGLALLCVAATANATITDNNSYTTDTASELDWLDVTLSRNRSYADVSSQFGVDGDFEGWRYATGDEFNTLVGNYIGTALPQGFYLPIYHTEDKIDGLVTLLGSTLDAAYIEQYGQTYDAIGGYAEGDGVDITWGFLAVFPGETYPWSAYIHDANASNYDYTAATGSRWGSFDYKHIELGSFLVRDTMSPIPIPATAWLFGSGLLGLIGLQKQRKSSVA